MSSSGGLGTLLPQAGTGSNATGMLGEREVVRNTGKQAIVSFLEAQSCYNVLRDSGKVVVFDTRIPIQLAFYALVEHGEILLLTCLILCLLAAPWWHFQYWRVANFEEMQSGFG